MSENARAFTVMTATRLLGDPYIWGGDDHDEGGFDCSGFIHEVFSRVAQCWPQLAFGRTTAQGLYEHFAKDCQTLRHEAHLRPGCLVFFTATPSSRIYHVKLHVSAGPFGYLAIDSGGAGSNSPDLASALRHAAGVRMSSSIHHGSALWKAVDPFELLG